MTPADRLQRTVQALIERERRRLDAGEIRDLHVIRIICKPRGQEWRAALNIETVEVEL